MRIPPIFAIAAASLQLASGALFAAPETYRIDPAHSTIGFKVRHMVSRVTGRFADVTGTIKVDPNHPENASVEAVIKIASIDTSNEMRDKHLQSPDFFDVAKFAEMTFKSKAVKQIDKETADVTGDLTMHGITKEVVLHVKFLGKANGPDGIPQTGWEATAKIDRTDFGLKWNKAVEGVSMVGDEVEITLQIESDIEK